MGKQIGIINVRGKVGDMAYVKSEDGYFIRRKTSVNKERIATDPKFIRTRLVNSEFRTASKAAKLLRDAVKIQLQMAGDSKLASRMVKVMLQIAATDTASDLGQRTAAKGELGFLEGFEFNRKNELQSTFLVQYVPAIDRAGGKATIDFPAFNPSKVLMVPQGASHFTLVTAACELDFENGKYVLGVEDSDFFPATNDSVPAFSMINDLTPASTLPIALVLGIRFYDKINGKYYQINADEYNAVRIVKTDQP